MTERMHDPCYNMSIIINALLKQPRTVRELCHNTRLGAEQIRTELNTLLREGKVQPFYPPGDSRIFWRLHPTYSRTLINVPWRNDKP